MSEKAAALRSFAFRLVVGDEAESVPSPHVRASSLFLHSGRPTAIRSFEPRQAPELAVGMQAATANTQFSCQPV